MERNTVEFLWNRRDRLGIMAEILTVAKDGRLKTQIMYGVNLSFSQLHEYLSFLTEMGFLSIRVENRKRTYETTAKGIKYVESYMEMSTLLRKSDSAEAPIPLI
jgi:predicted transcriptional regulator